MITILYDTALERDALRDYIKSSPGCVDFSDDQDDEQCALGSCKTCKELFIINNLMQRTDYQNVNPFLKNRQDSCSTCTNRPICWLATTAAAPGACIHYIPDRRNTQ